MQGISCVFKDMTTNHRAAWKTGGLAWPKLQFCGNVKTRKFVIATHSTKVFKLKLLKSLDGVSYQEKMLLRQNNLNKQSWVHENSNFSGIPKSPRRAFVIGQLMCHNPL